MPKPRIPGRKNQMPASRWASTMPTSDSVPDISSTDTTAKPSGTS